MNENLAFAAKLKKDQSTFLARSDVSLIFLVKTMLIDVMTVSQTSFHSSRYSYFLRKIFAMPKTVVALYL